MKKLRSGIALGLGLVVALTTIQPAVASEAAPNTVTTGSTTSEIIEASVSAAEAMQDFGIEPEDYYEAAPAESDFLNEVATLALAGVDDPEAMSSATTTTTCESSERAAYSAQIAATNSARDANARTDAEETMYMYLSHYIDMAPSLVGTTCDFNSAAPRYSAWITNNDRNAYDSFLSVIGLTDAVSTFSDAIVTAGTVKAIPTMRTDLGKVAQAATFTVEGANFGFTSATARGLADDLVAASQGGGTPAQALEALEESLTPDMPTVYAGAAAAIVAAMVAPVLVVPIATIGLAMVPVFAMLGTTIVNYAAWSSLIYSSNSRVSGRMMRYLGM